MQTPTGKRISRQEASRRSPVWSGIILVTLWFVPDKRGGFSGRFFKQSHQLLKPPAIAAVREELAEAGRIINHTIGSAGFHSRRRKGEDPPRPHPLTQVTPRAPFTQHRYASLLPRLPQVEANRFQICQARSGRSTARVFVPPGAVAHSIQLKPSELPWRVFSASVRHTSSSAQLRPRRRSVRARAREKGCRPAHVSRLQVQR